MPFDELLAAHSAGDARLSSLADERRRRFRSLRYAERKPYDLASGTERIAFSIDCKRLPGEQLSCVARRYSSTYNLGEGRSMGASQFPLECARVFAPKGTYDCTPSVSSKSALARTVFFKRLGEIRDSRAPSGTFFLAQRIGKPSAQCRRRDSLLGMS
jgi:hypothetical protein